MHMVRALALGKGALIRVLHPVQICAKCAIMIKDAIIDIERRLKERGISVHQFCQDIGVSRTTWQRWKAGVVNPRLETWLRVQELVPPKEKKGRAA